MAMFPSYDCDGPLTRTVEDCAIVLQAIAGYGPHDPSSVRAPVGNYIGALESGVPGVRIRVPRAHFFEHATDEVRAATEAVVVRLRDLGAEIRDVSIAGLDTWWSRA
jgi:aspartyl-tRNA(Asn)/glutamyl-tRNA(Gln) amidotransferase subunit A